MKSLPKNSIVHYCDIGCVYKNTPEVDIGVLDNLFNLCQEKGMIAFNYSPPKNIDKKYGYYKNVQKNIEGETEQYSIMKLTTIFCWILFYKELPKELRLFRNVDETI